MRVPFDFESRPVKVKPARYTKATICGQELHALFLCWRSNAVDHVACEQFVSKLSGCMEVQATAAKKSNSYNDINKWLRVVWKNKRLG